MDRTLPMQYQGPSSSVARTLQFPWATTVSSVTSVKAWKDGTDVSSTTLSGSNTATGNTIALKTLGALIGGEVYILEVVAVVDGVTDTWWLPVTCLKAATGKT